MLDFFSQSNSDYIESLYQQYRENPDSIDIKWASFFAGLEAAGQKPFFSSDSADQAQSFKFTEGIKDLVNSYRTHGHFEAHINPLDDSGESHPFLNLQELGYTEADLNKPVIDGGFQGEFDGTLGGLIEGLRETYCQKIGVEFMEITDKTQRDWLIDRIETHKNRPQLDKEDKKALYTEILRTELFEQFIHKKYLGQKRFSIEGGEVTIPLINKMIDHSADLGVKEIMLGMAHRGRLNVLTHVMQKPYASMLSEFEGTQQNSADKDSEGDVKYHMGFSSSRMTPSGTAVHCSLSPNPSHLEMVDPVIEGRVRAKQLKRGDQDHSQVVPFLIHGDAAFTGQGIVPETLSLTQFKHFRTGGTIHMIINNQLGFTATADETRFSRYPTDVAKMISAPIFHINGDDPESVYLIAKLAMEFRQKFKSDVIIDIWCYRRFGHNESDDPTFTQPLMYQKIKNHPTITQLYKETLLNEDSLTEDEFTQIRSEILEKLNRAYEDGKTGASCARISKFQGEWATYDDKKETKAPETSITPKKIESLGQTLTSFPSDFEPYAKIQKLMGNRHEMSLGKKPVDWATAESWAFGSLLTEGFSVRLTGQDVERATFSHRHAVWNDVNSGQKHSPFFDLTNEETHFTICNSMLSELAVLGYEFGYSLVSPKNLVIWEAQFGDFVNGAQPIVDLFIVCSDTKWQRMSGLVMLLPHGYEGQGPEHSSARLERFLQLCADDNIQVAYPTTPAQYFHLLRRQMHQTFRKPLIVMTPKSLLRYTPAMSAREDFTKKKFENILITPAQQEPHKVIFCSGKVYYTLLRELENRGTKNICLIRLEQLYPFPEAEIKKALKTLKGVISFSWAQEEPRNMGSWFFTQDRLNSLLPEGHQIQYAGRDASASPATGWHWLHEIEEKQLVDQALKS